MKEAIVNPEAVKALAEDVEALNSKIASYRNTDGTLKYITSGDVRSINESGRYYMSGSVQNLPNASAHYVDVYVYSTSEGGYKYLVACKQNDGTLYTCKCSAGVWTNWEELALNSKMANNAVIGDRITVPIDTSSVGIKTGTFTTPTAPSGYTLAAYIGVGNSYRLCFLGCGGDSVYAYVGTAFGTNIDVYFYPIFKKT